MQKWNNVADSNTQCYMYIICSILSIVFSTSSLANTAKKLHLFVLLVERKTCNKQAANQDMHFSKASTGMR